MKKIFTLLSLLLVFGFINAKHIDENTARQIGINFLINNSNTASVASAQLSLVYTAVPEGNAINSIGEQEKYFYIFNTGKNGFIMVSADDIVSPILGYSNQNNFNTENMPSHISAWLEGYKKEIQYAIENKIPATESVMVEWENLKQVNNKDIPQTKTVIMQPLLKTTWNQMPYYNALCPYDEGENDRTVTGCVATAMAQVMKYWSFPEKGKGSHTYYSGYGELSADFGNTTYKWASMPNSLSGANNAIATLMYQLGVSIEMNYGTANTGGSGAWMIAQNSEYCSENALKDYFGYKKSMQGIQRYGYSDAQWMKLIKDELNAYRPVIYVGYGTGGGHCFVADGYDDNNYFHFNWGWGGSSDGYFKLNALNPGSLGAGGGSGGFNTGQQILIGIEPEYGNPDYNIALNTAITAPKNTIQYKQGFNFSANIQNKGNNNFEGDFVGVMVDHSFNVVAYFDTISNNNILASATQNLTFNTDGLFSVIPGDYYVCVYYRPTGDDKWYKVSNDQDYTNLMDIKVINSGDISLNSTFYIATGNSFTQGKPASVKVDIINNHFNTFFGKYNLSIYNLDGTLAQTIGEYEETNGLAYNKSYNSSYIDFSSSNNISIDPGTYILALKYKENNLDWQFAGAGNFQNPMLIKILPPPLAADKYEQNNTLYWSYSLPFSFVNNVAVVKTEGANIHTMSDKDYYKIILPVASQYTVKANLIDANNSSGNMSYTLDAVFKYSTDGTSWSGNIDGNMNAGIEVNGGKTFYLNVVPNTDQEMGNYDLEIEIIKNTTGNISNALSGSIDIFPNPVKDMLTVNADNDKAEINKIEIYDIRGRLLISLSNLHQNKQVALPIGNMANGIYFLKINTDIGTVSKKIVIEK